MSERKMYRSAIRSKKLIRQAFFDLLKEKNFEKITVTDIVNRAEINRSTFYAHYPDVMGVVDEIQDEILDYTRKFFANIKLGDFFENPLPHLKNIVQIAEENMELYRLMCASAMGTKQLERLKSVLIDHIIEAMETTDDEKGSLDLEFSIRFFIGGVVDVYTQWMHGEIDCTLDDITEQLAKMISNSNKNGRKL